MTKSFPRKYRKSLNFSYVWLLIGTTLICIGMVLGGHTLLDSWLAEKGNHGQVLSNNKPYQTPAPLVEGIPVRISIPSTEIDLKIIPGYYYLSTGNWTLSLNDAQWGTITAKPNNKSGATFIYAHNRARVFNTLPNVQVGDEAYVITDNGHTFTYKFVSSAVTTPDDTRVLHYRGKPVLVLQTCTGLWYQNRQLFFFDLI